MKYFPLLNSLFKFVIYTSKRYNIDESHALKHSMDVHYFSSKIYENELPLNPLLEEQFNIILASSILHDMCDKKYIDQTKGIDNIKMFLSDKLTPTENSIVQNIITTMSYSTVKKNGYPLLGDYQNTYHIVREADLLAAYDFDRCVIYSMSQNNNNYEDSIKFSIDLFENRVLKYIDDGLFTTQYAKLLSKNLHKSALNKLNSIKKLYKIR
jgi:HD superfamily phosphodiesterase